MKSKTWFIPDIHGCSKTLKYLIEEKIKPEKHDHLIFLGDYIDRGPDSKGVIDFILGLQEKPFRVTTLKGNHEAVCIQTYYEDLKLKSYLGIKSKTTIQKNWEAYGGNKTLDSFGVKRPRLIPKKYIQWMENLELFVETDDFIAVHAGLNFNIENPFTDARSMLWIRDFEVDSKKIRNKKLIHGHVPVNLELIELSIKSSDIKFIDLDNGIYMAGKPGYGNLVTLEWESKDFIILPVIDNVTYRYHLP